jgi:hypothetical protein
MAYRLTIGPIANNCKLVDTATGKEVTGISCIKIPALNAGDPVLIEVTLLAELDVLADVANVHIHTEGSPA